MNKLVDTIVDSLGKNYPFDHKLLESDFAQDAIKYYQDGLTELEVEETSARTIAEHTVASWLTIITQLGYSLTKDNDLQEHDITTEEWREYDFEGRVYRIDNPHTLFTRPKGTTHRVVDSTGQVHCVPAPGEHGCVLRWQNKDKSKPVNF